MLKKWNDLIISYLRQNADFDEFRNVLIEMKKEGVTKEDAYSFFTNPRNKMTEEKNENNEDKILEILDIISGHCSPHLKVWE